MGKAVETDDQEALAGAKLTFGYGVIGIIAATFAIKMVMVDFWAAFGEVFVTVVSVLCYWWVVGKHEEYLK